MCGVAKPTQIREVSPMDITRFMIAGFSVLEDFLTGQRLRKRGPQPTLRDSEVLIVAMFNSKRVWVRDLWHLTSHWMRKFLSHTLAIFFWSQNDLPYLSFAKLVYT